MLIIGLGNPGQEYIGTRHNVGRDFLLSLAERMGFSEWSKDSYTNSLLLKAQDLNDKEIIFALPETFMNLSGIAVRELMRKYKLSSEELLVIYDDIDLPVGSIRISKGRGAGGHNGVESIINHLGTKDFARIRIGICPITEDGEKSKPSKDEVSRFVLRKFSPEEDEKLQKTLKEIPQIMKMIIGQGIEDAMNAFNKK